jgi:hypothetical protein
MDPVFADGLRESLIRRVESAPRRRLARPWRWGIGAVLITGLLGSGTAIAAQLSVQPGGDVHTDLATPVVTSRVGTASIPLGVRPKGASEVSLQFFPQDVGTYAFGRGGASETVTAAMLARSVGPASTTSGDLPTAAVVLRVAQLDPGGRSFTITTSASTLRWSASLTWVGSRTTPWGINARGQTYGMQNADGTPDLVAVEATNGNDGYAYRKDLDDADGIASIKSFSSPQDALKWQRAHQGRVVRVPVYESDGTTMVGTFCIGARC